MQKEMAIYNPYFRKNLLKSIIGLNLSDIRLTILKDFLPKFVDYKTIHQRTRIAIAANLEFSNGKTFYFRGLRPNHSELKSSFRASESIYTASHLATDKDQFPANTTIESREISISIADLIVEKSPNLFTVSNPITSSFLLKETPYFRTQIQDIRWFNPFAIRGFSLKFKDGSIINIYVGYKGTEGLFHIDLDDNIMDNGWLSRSSQFSQENDRSIERETLSLSNSTFLQKQLLEEKDLTNWNIINPIRFFKSHDDFLAATQKILKIHSTEIRQRQLSFLALLKQDFTVLNYGVPELTLAVNDEGKMKIVGPVDILPKLEENDFFLDRLIALWEMN